MNTREENKATARCSSPGEEAAAKKSDDTRARDAHESVSVSSAATV